MLFQIFVGLPSLVMTEMAWCIRVAIAVTCLVVLFAVAIGAIGVLYRRRANVGPNHGRTPTRTALKCALLPGSPLLTRSSNSSGMK